MDRIKEYNRLLAELEQPPETLAASVERAHEKYNKERKRRYMKPIGWVAGFMLVFIFLVNTSAPFAMALSRIPVLKDLVEFVAFSPSLTTAVENDYVQWVGLEEYEDGIQMGIEYIIVDQKQVNIFYTLNTMESGNGFYEINPWIEGEELDSYVLSSFGRGEENGDMGRIAIDFMENEVPDSLQLVCELYYIEEGIAVPVADDLFTEDHQQMERKPDATFNFFLSFDSTCTAEKKEIFVNREFVLDGQKLLLEKVEILPTHMSIYLKDDENNTAWLKGLNLYVENEKNEQFAAIASGITALGAADSKSMHSYRLESPYFYNSGQLVLYITGATWLEKDMDLVLLDLKNVQAESLPEGVEFYGVEYAQGHVKLKFLANANKDGGFYQLFETVYYDALYHRNDPHEGADGEIDNTAGISPNALANKYEYDSWSSASYDEQGESGRFMVQFVLKNYPYDEVYLLPVYSHKTILPVPERIVLE